MRQQRNMFKTKEQDKTPEEKPSEVEIDNLLSRKFKVMIVKMFKQLRTKLDEQIEKLEVFNKELENIKKNQAEMKNTITKMKNTGLPWWSSG